MIVNNVNVRARCKELIQFFYPDYYLTSTYSPFIENGVIFDGDAKALQMFRNNGVNYIYIKGAPEYDLTVANNLLSFVYKKWDREPPKYLDEFFKTLDYPKSQDDVDVVEEICKSVWVTGKHGYNEENDDSFKIFLEIFSSGNQQKIIKTILELSEKTSANDVFRKVKSFLMNVNRDDNSKLSVWYQRKLLTFKSAFGQNIYDAVLNYLYSDISSEELRLLKLAEDATKPRMAKF